MRWLPCCSDHLLESLLMCLETQKDRRREILLEWKEKTKCDVNRTFKRLTAKCQIASPKLAGNSRAPKQLVQLGLLPTFQMHCAYKYIALLFVLLPVTNCQDTNTILNATLSSSNSSSFPQYSCVFRRNISLQRGRAGQVFSLFLQNHDPYFFIFTMKPRNFPTYHFLLSLLLCHSGSVLATTFGQSDLNALDFHTLIGGPMMATLEAQVSIFLCDAN